MSLNRFPTRWVDPGEENWHPDQPSAPQPDAEFTERKPLVLYLPNGSQHRIHEPWGFAKRKHR
jgi:hypothetical protein